MSSVRLMLLTLALGLATACAHKPPACSQPGHTCQSGQCKADKSCCGNECKNCDGKSSCSGGHCEHHKS